MTENQALQLVVGAEDDSWDDVATLGDSLRQGQPRIPSYFGYDDTGSLLFEDVTRLPQYYLTRVEQSLLERCSEELAGRIGAQSLVELGSGSAKKTGTILAEMARHRRPHFVPLEVNKFMIERSFADLADVVPGLRCTGVVGRYEDTIPQLTDLGVTSRCTALLGSNIGNMLTQERHELLSSITACSSAGDTVFLTADLTKSKSLLESAYNDDPTDRTFTRFRLNRLHHLNRLYGSSFSPGGCYEFAHYDPGLERVEAHVYFAEECVVHLGSIGGELVVPRGSSVVVDYAVKFRVAGLVDEMRGHGARLVTSWVDDDYRYGAFLFEVLGR